MKIIVLISGKAQSGKDTIGEYLVSNYGFKRYAFADKLKEVALELGWDGEKDFKGRRLLQELGSVLRNYDKDTWVKIVIKKICEDFPNKIVITDCRYVNEYIYMSDFARRNGYALVPLRVVRDGFNLEGELGRHESEMETDLIPGIIVKNDGSPEELYKKIDYLISDGVDQYLDMER